MRTALIGLLIILTMGCSQTSQIVKPPEKYCPKPDRPVLVAPDIWTVQDLANINLILVDYALKLEKTIDCYEPKSEKEK